MATITLDFTGLDGLQERLRQAVERFGDLGPLMERISEILLGSTEARFITGKDPAGAAWKPSWRAQRLGGKTLVETSRLASSFERAFGPKSAEVGTNLVYAPIHQFGGVIRPKAAKALRFFIKGVGWRSAKQVTMPKRAFLGVSDADRGEITTAIDGFMEGVFAP